MATAALKPDRSDRPDNQRDPNEPAAGRHRMLPIMANLLPPEIVDARRARRLKRTVSYTLCGCLVLLAAWFGTARLDTADAQAELDNAQGGEHGLSREERKYDGLVKTQGETKVIKDRLAKLLADDLQWSTLVESVLGAAPAGVQVTGITGALTPPEARTAAGAAGGVAGGAVPGTAGTAVPVGTVTVSGLGSGKPAVAGYVDALGKVPGFTNPFLNNATENTETTTKDDMVFTVRVDITKAMLGGRHTPATPAAPPASAAPTASPAPTASAAPAGDKAGG